MECFARNAETAFWNSSNGGDKFGGAKLFREYESSSIWVATTCTSGALGRIRFNAVSVVTSTRQKAGNVDRANASSKD